MGSHVGLDELHMMGQTFKAIDSLQSLTTFQKDSLNALDKGNDVFFVCGNWGGKSIVYQAYAMFLKTLTSKNLVNTITNQGLNGMLIVS